MAKTGAKFFKFLKLFAWVATFIILFFIIASTILFETNFGKRTSGKMVADFLSSKLKTKVVINSFSIGYLGARIKGVELYDEKDTLVLSINELHLKYNSLRQSPRNLKISFMEITRPYLNMVRHGRGESFSYEVLIRRLFPPSEGESSSKFSVRKILLKNGTWRLHEPERTKSLGLMHYNDFYVTDISSTLKNFRIYKGILEADIESLNGQDKSTFLIKNSSGKLTIDSAKINLTGMTLNLCESEFHGNFGFFFDNYQAFADFNSSVEIRANLHDSRLNLKDLRFFSQELQTYVDNIFIEGDVKGTLDNMKGNDLVIRYGKDFKYIGKAKLVGLPVWQETYFDLDATSLYFSFSDLSKLIPSLSFSPMLTESGRLLFVGKYSGFLNDFVAYGTIASKFGKIKTDINLKLPENGLSVYSGNMELNDFQLGQFLGVKEIGRTTLQANIKGNGFDLKEITANLNASANYFEFKNYTYTNLKFNGDIIKELINGKFTVSDQNLDLDFKGSIDLGRKKPQYNFTADIKTANLQNLNLYKDYLQLKGIIEISASASNLDDIDGRVLVLNGRAETTASIYRANTILIQSKPVSDKKFLTVRSDLIDASMDGKFNFEDIPNIILYSFSHYVDSSLFKVKKNPEQGQFLNFDVTFNKTDFINQLLKNQIVFTDNSRVKGYFSVNDHAIKVNANMPGLSIRNYNFGTLLLNLSSKGKILSVYSSFSNLFKSDSILAENVNLSASSSKDNVNFTSYLFNPQYKTHLALNGGMKLSNDSALVVLNNSYLTNKLSEKWNINSDTVIINFKPEIYVSYLELTNANHILKAVGTISKSGDKPLRLVVDNISFDFFKNYIPVNLSMFDGTVNGQLVIFNLLGNAYFDAAFSVNPLFYEGDKELGTLILTSSHNPVSYKTNINGKLYSTGMDDVMEINGYFDFVKTKTMDLNVEVPQTSLSNFEPFVSFMASDIEGDVNANVRFSGPLSKYKVEGKAYFTNAYFTIDYLKTRYHFTDQARMDENGIYLENIVAYDEFGNQASIFGGVKHRYFNDFYLNIGIIGYNIHGLNTTSNDNSIYYGNAFASGRVDITGPLNNIKMNMQLKSEPNTKIYLNAYDDNTFGNYKYIRFTQGSSSFNQYSSNDMSGISVNLDMEITPDVELTIIFDPVTDDVIRAKGSGNLKLLVDEYGNNNMWGTVFIDEGTYTFSTIIKRKFNVTKGSSLTWKGDVYEADANIEAIYKLEASVYSLIKDNKNMSQEEKDLYRQTNFPINAKLILTGNLFSPDVKLDFEILNTGTLSSGKQDIFLNQQIANIKNNEQELNKQVISLLLLNSFLPPETGLTGIASESDFNLNIGSLLSNQWNQWLSGFSRHINTKYINNIQFGVNYANEKQYQRELDVLLSGSLFNDRVDFSGSYDIENDNTNFQVNFQPIKSSRLRIKVFNKAENNLAYQQDINRQGIGLFFKQDFDKWGEIIRRKRNVIYSK